MVSKAYRAAYWNYSFAVPLYFTKKLNSLNKYANFVFCKKLIEEQIAVSSYSKNAFPVNWETFSFHYIAISVEVSTSQWSIHMLIALLLPDILESML